MLYRATLIVLHISTPSTQRGTRNLSERVASLRHRRGASGGLQHRHPMLPACLLRRQHAQVAASAHAAVAVCDRRRHGFRRRRRRQRRRKGRLSGHRRRRGRVRHSWRTRPASGPWACSAFPACRRRLQRQRRRRWRRRTWRRHNGRLKTAARAGDCRRRARRRAAAPPQRVQGQRPRRTIRWHCQRRRRGQPRRWAG